MSIYIKIFWEFFKIGLFAVGGGMATLPFLQALAETTGWYSQAFITDMVAISESTPGPIGINMATYVGYNVAGVLGGIVATVAEILPALIIATLISSYLGKFRENRYVEYAFYGMRPAVTGLIAAAGWGIAKLILLNIDAFQVSGNIPDLFEPVKLLYFGVILFAVLKFKKHPIVYIAISAVVGIVLKF